MTALTLRYIADQEALEVFYGDRILCLVETDGLLWYYNTTDAITATRAAGTKIIQRGAATGRRDFLAGLAAAFDDLPDIAS